MRTTSTLHISRILRIRYAAAMLTLAATFSNCSSGDRSPTSPAVPKPAVASVVLVGLPQNGVLLVGTTAELRATAMDATGEVVSGTVVSWSSSNSAVAIVSPSGMVTAVAAGFSVISASAEGRSATASLEVRAAIATPDAGATQPVTTTALSGAVTMTVPPGATAPGTKLDVGPAGSATVPAAPELVAGSAFTFGPDGTQFAKPVMLTLKYDPAGLSPSSQAGLAIHLAQNGDWVPVAGSIVNTATGTVTAPVTHFSTYALLTPGAAASVAIADGTGQSATAGAAVAVAPSVLVRDSRSRPVANAAVTFAITSGGGSLAAGGSSAASVSVTTGAAGTAALTSWTLGAAAGTNTLTATVAELPPVTFTATGTAALVPAIGLSSTNAHFTYSIGDATPGAQSVNVTNTGAGTLTGLALGTVTYGAGASGWLTATLSGALAPASIALAAHPGSLAAGSYSATVPVQSAVAGAATIQVTLDVSAAAPPPPSPATKLVITTSPSSAVESGVAFAVQPVVEIRDASNQRVVGATNAVTVTVLSGCGVFSGTTTVNAVNGVAIFTDLMLAGSANCTLDFASGALVHATSGAIAVTQVVRQLAVTQQPAGAVNGMHFTTQPIVEVRDAAGLRIGTASVPVTASIESGNGTLSSPAQIPSVNGAASNWNLSIVGSGSFILRFQSGGLSTASAVFDVISATPYQLVLVTPPINSESGVPVGGPPAVEVRDNLGLRVLDATTAVTASLDINPGSGSAGTLSGTTTVNAVNGVATFPNLIVTGQGTGFQLSFRSGTLLYAQSSVFTVGLAHSLSMVTQPAGAVNGVPFTTQPVVQLRDAAGNALSSGSNIVTASIASGSGTLGGTLSVAAVNGVATFTDLKLSGLGTFTIAFSSPGVAVGVTSATIATSGAATQLAVTVQPSAASESGVPLAVQPVVEIRDGSGVKIPGATTTVTASVAPGFGGSLLGTTTVNAVNGVATFTDLMIAGAGAGPIQFTAASAVSANSNFIAVTQVVRQLVVTRQPVGTVSDVPLATQPIVEVRDAAGLLITTANVSMTATVASGPGTLANTLTQTRQTLNGVANAWNLAIVASQTGNFTIQFQSGSVAATSASFAVQQGPPTGLHMVTEPGASESGVPVVGVPVVELRDTHLGRALDATNAVTVSLSTDAGSTAVGTLTGTTTVNAVNGVATFPNVVVTGSGSGFHLNFSAAPAAGQPAIATAQSGAFAVVLAHSLSIATQPSGAVSGVPFVTQPVVQLRDASGALVSTGSNIVTATLASGTGSLGGTVSVAAVNGVATFGDLRINGVGTFTIAFASPGVAVGATSASITTTAAVLHLSLSHSPGPFAESGIALTSQPTVEIRDAASNVVAGATDAVTVTVLVGTASIRGTTTVNAVNGVATFTDLNIAGAGNVTLQFSAATASGVSSATIGVSSILRHLAVVQQPASAVSGQYFTTSPTVQLLDGAGLPYTITNPQVSVALASGSGTLVLDKFYTIFSNGSGLATFPALKIVGSGTFTLQFTSLNGATTTSAPFSIVPGPASNIKITTTPAGAVNGVAFITQPVVTLIDASGIPTNSGSNVVTAFISAGSGTLSGTLAVAAANGVATFTDLKITGSGAHTISFSGAGGLGVVTASVAVSP